MHSSSTLLKDLLANPRFVAWARGEQPEDNRHWNNWAADDQEKQEIIAIAKELLDSFQIPDQHITDEHISSKISQALNTAKCIENERESRKLILFKSFRSVEWNVAASLVILLGLALALFGVYKKGYFRTDQKADLAKADDNNAFTEISNQGQQVKYVRLSDGSAIVLHKNSSVRFPKHFAKTGREVFLTGEAFFEVTKNPEQPFFVYANELVAKVHGTSFSVKAGENDTQIIVAVKTGKVSVYTQQDAKAIQYKADKNLTALVLTPNQQATFMRNEAKLTRLALKSPVLLHIPIEDQIFTYAETPVAMVFEALEKAYGVKINFNKEIMGQCSITATLGDEPLENKLRWICTILEAEYAIKDDQITIKGSSCK
ncbi:FecR family protein [Dyadobacter sp. CY107]|uniref:FecR family protein n=1 Tax=Dyadobacter fanqingshengii TaxID=2906443 RepID=UPI001F2B1C0B|nr:FecR family protein [Dyadobacter fanqingshengii]MCF2504480.1 FecR family protein [Dyadobacter fanqingshengii]